jgi:hypothetical protein
MHLTKAEGRETFPVCRPKLPIAIDLVEARQRFGFLVVNVEYRKKLSDREQILDLLGQVKKFKAAAFFVDCGKA